MMKNKNLQPKYKISKTSMGRGEQSRVTSPSLSKLSMSEMERVVGGNSAIADEGGGIFN